jgi:hypothetical protein
MAPGLGLQGLKLFSGEDIVTAHVDNGERGCKGVDYSNKRIGESSIWGWIGRAIAGGGGGGMIKAQCTMFNVQ